MYDVMSLPLEAFSYSSNSYAQIFNTVSAVFWTFELFANFTVSYFDGVSYETDPLRIIMYHLKTDFPLNFFLVTLDWIVILAEFAFRGGALRLLRTVRIARCLKMFNALRLYHFRRLIREISDRMQHEIWIAALHSAEMLILIFLFCHYFACGWYALGISNGWVLFSCITEPFYLYCISFHWVFSLFTPCPPPRQVGAVNLREQLFLILQLFCGLVLFTSIIGRLTANVTVAVKATVALREKHSAFKRFVEQNAVSRQLGKDILVCMRRRKPVHPWLKLEQIEALKDYQSNLRYSCIMRFSHQYLVLTRFGLGFSSLIQQELRSCAMKLCQNPSL